MNAERLHHILVELKNEMKENNTTSHLQGLISALQNVINSPQPNHQTALANNLKAFYGSVNNATSDLFSPTSRQILIEIGGEKLFGKNLKQTVEDIFAQNQITPAVALDELKILYKEIELFENAIRDGSSALNQLGIGDETLPAGNCEIGILIPRKAVKNRLVDFADELKDMSFILNTFAEVATGSKDELKIRNISSSELLIYLEAAVPYATCLAVAIERIVALYKSLLEIRKLRGELQRQGVPDSATTGVDDHANKMMSDGMEKLATEIVEKYYKGRDPGRKNELTNAVRFSLNKLANRIDCGFNVEVRIQPLEENNQDVEQELKDAIQVIKAASSNMQFLKLEGQPILRLPEKNEMKEAEKKEDKQKKEKKS